MTPDCADADTDFLALLEARLRAVRALGRQTTRLVIVAGGDAALAEGTAARVARAMWDTESSLRLCTVDALHAPLPPEATRVVVGGSGDPRLEYRFLRSHATLDAVWILPDLAACSWTLLNPQALVLLDAAAARAATKDARAPRVTPPCVVDGILRTVLPRE